MQVNRHCVSVLLTVDGGLAPVWRSRHEDQQRLNNALLWMGAATIHIKSVSVHYIYNILNSLPGHHTALSDRKLRR